MTRIVEIVELCKHEMFGPHPLPVIDGGAVPASPSEWTDDCPGGFRRVLTEGEYLLVEKQDGKWPVWAMRAMGEAEPEAIRTARWGAYFDALADGADQEGNDG